MENKTKPNRNAVLISLFYNWVLHNLHKNGVDVETIQNTLNETKNDYLDLHKGAKVLEDILGDLEIIQYAEQSPRSFEEYMKEFA